MHNESESNGRSNLEFLVRFAHCLAVLLLAPVVAIFTKVSAYLAIEQE